MMKENDATQEELYSNAGAKTNDNGGLGTALQLCGFSIASVKMRKTDRRGREAVRELRGGWRARALCAPWRTRFSRPVRFPCSQSPFPVNNHH
ncbi:unnamed protein product [Sphagnum balticum]